MIADYQISGFTDSWIPDSRLSAAAMAGCGSGGGGPVHGSTRGMKSGRSKELRKDRESPTLFGELHCPVVVVNVALSMTDPFLGQKEFLNDPEA